MITNEREYRITTAEAERFVQALARADELAADLDPRLRQAMREGLESQLGEVREQLAAYETAVLSEAALAADWNRPEEDAAWSHLQPERSS